MGNIYAIGESLVDIIFREGQPQAAKAGGAMLNSAVTLGRIGLPVSLITEYGNDDIGNLIDKFLKDNGVGTGFVHRFSQGQTALAMAFLDEKNDARYTFYKNYLSKRLDTDLPEINAGDILLYGSIYSVTPEIREPFYRLVSDANKRGALLVYDPNFRKSHLDQLEKMKPMIIENLKAASVIRGSNEDFINIFSAETPEKAWESTRDMCGCLIYTASTEGIYVVTPSFSGKFAVNKITPVSTIGAGDNFNAGLIASFYRQKISGADLINLGRKEWEGVISTAASFAENVCLSYDNYIDSAFASRYRSASRLHM
jgi:fructokinase